ncbi:MAG TPA: peptide chain release factor N(5)-glutamine methyltransferase [Steroidobacteraceae bacterium]
MATEIRRLVEEGAARLARIADEPRREAELLLAAALDRPRAWLLARPEQEVLDCDATDRFESHITRRSIGEPIAYILGKKEFWSLALAVTPDVLVPRPETELVVERALAHLPDAGSRVHGQVGVRPSRVLDLATGSGAIGLAIAHERPFCQVVGTDISPAAAAIASANARRLGLGNAEFRSGDWYAPVAGEVFDLIASNPPYVPDDDPRLDWSARVYEPAWALYAGPTGLEALARVIAGAGARLALDGWLVLEHGLDQADDVRRLLREAGFVEVTTHRDSAAHERCTEGRRPEKGSDLFSARPMR